MNNDIKGYLFDYGGTLDTCGCHWGKKIWHAYEECNVPVAEQDFRDAYVHGERTLGKNRIIMPEHTFRHTLDVKLALQMQWITDNGRWTTNVADWQTLHDAVLDTLYTDVVKTQKHSREVLETLAKNYPLVLVSNFYGNVGVVLKEFSLDHLFQDIIESAVVGIRKPDPQIFQLGVDALHMDAANIMVVGDSIDKDIVPAKSIGCQTAWYKGEGWTDAPQDETAADIVISDLAQLISR